MSGTSWVGRSFVCPLFDLAIIGGGPGLVVASSPLSLTFYAACSGLA